MDYDFELARKLQQEELKNTDVYVVNTSGKENRLPQTNDLNCTQNLVHPEWEIIDPTPNIHILKDLYDKKFFQGKLVSVELEWSKQMYKCAGICYQRQNRFGMKSCTIRLSEPLLKLRSRKDLVETLIHEMIHAYLFVLNIREGNGGHGPNFKRIMEGINRQAGTNISVYHSFHDEVRLYQKHWWRCNGPCRDRKPFYGYVKRCMNRPPGPNDFWFAQHQQDCGGTFIKIKEPTPKKRAPKTTKPISDYMATTKGGGTTKINRGSATIVITKPPSTKTVPKPVKPPAPSNIRTIGSPPTHINPKKPNLPSNIVGFKDVGQNTGAVPKPPTTLFSNGGQTLGGSSGKRSRLLDQFEPSTSKKHKTDNHNDSVILLDDGEDDILLAVDLDEIERQNNTTLTQQDKAKARQTIIKQEILDSTGLTDDNDIILIDDEYDNELADTDDLNLSKNVILDLFTDDMLGNDGTTKEDDDGKVPCPICYIRVKASEQKVHVDQCYEDILRANSPSSSKFRTKKSPTVIKQEPNDDVIVITDTTNENKVQCPVCPIFVPPDKINEHLDKCLEHSFDDEF